VYGEPGAGVSEPSLFTWSLKKGSPGCPMACAKINGSEGEASSEAPPMYGLELLSSAVNVPSCIRNVPADEYRYVLVESTASPPVDSTGVTAPISDG